MTRLLLTVAVVAFFVLCLAGMRWGWRNRARRQAAYLPALPTPPDDLADPLLPPLAGVYVGTTTAGDWQDRIVVGDLGHRAAAELALHPGGLLVDRTGASPLWIAAGSLVAARTDRALAGKAMGIDGLLVVRWRLGAHELDTGLRADDKDEYPAWIEAIHGLVEQTARPAGAHGGDE